MIISISLFGLDKFIFGFIPTFSLNIKVCSPLQARFGNGAGYQVVPQNN